MKQTMNVMPAATESLLNDGAAQHTITASTPITTAARPTVLHRSRRFSYLVDLSSPVISMRMSASILLGLSFISLVVDVHYAKIAISPLNSK